MLNTDRVLLTGITGAVGSWLAREALDRGVKVSALVREETHSAAVGRVKTALDAVDRGDRHQEIDVIVGDICSDRLGVNGSKASLKDVSLLLHCAASTKFEDSDVEMTHRLNVGGTVNALQLAEDLNIPFCHISTAYIAGRRRGIAKENQIDVGQDFHNAYERTKCEAEVLVRQWEARTGLPVVIFRPGIVLGDGMKGRIARFNGVYSMLRFFDIVAPAAADGQIRVLARAAATKNLIPADYAAKAMWHILSRKSTGTYHITNPFPPTLSKLRDIFLDLFGIDGKLVDERDFENNKPSRSELLFMKVNSHYAPYLASEPIFDRTNTDAALSDADFHMRSLDASYFTQLVKFARSVQWGKAKLRQARSLRLSPTTAV